MKRIFFITVFCFFGVTASFAKEGFERRPINNNIWMETGHTLNRGEFVIGLGTSVGFGITDHIQVGTNVLGWLIQYYNVNVKVELMQNEYSSLAAGLSVGKLNLDVYGSEDDFNAITPFVSYSFKAGENTTMHFGGKFASFSGDSDVNDAEPEATIDGTAFSGGLNYDWSNKTKFLAEAGYDITFKGPKIGGAVLWGWEKFRLKLGVSYYDPEGDVSFALPIIGLWWRFDG